MPPGRPRLLPRCEAHENASGATCRRCRACCVLRGVEPGKRKPGTTGAERARRAKAAKEEPTP